VIALLAVLAMLTGPVLVVHGSRSGGRRVRAQHGPGPISREDFRGQITDGEAWTIVGGLLLTAAGVATLAAMAVFG
jgi:hypothetical protein